MLLYQLAFDVHSAFLNKMMSQVFSFSLPFRFKYFELCRFFISGAMDVGRMVVKHNRVWYHLNHINA